MKVSIFDVAKKSGLSVVTVSRVLNGAGTVREKNRQRVLDAMKELDYRPSAAARSLARGKTGIIGLMLATLQDSFYDRIISEINEILEEHGYYLAVSVTKSPPGEASHYLIQEDRVDGLILLSPTEEDYYIEELKRRNIPYVLIDNQHEANDDYSVTVNNFKGGYMAGQLLTELGYRSIAHLSGDEIYRSTKERRAGFVKALDDAGLAPFELVRGKYETEFGYQTAKRWIAAGKLPDAVFAGDDYIAAGLINAFKESGIRVPEDVSVVGYDDQDIASMLRPFVTTVRQPANLIAAAAADLLLRQVGGSQSGDEDEGMDEAARLTGHRVDPELIVRQSTRSIGTTMKE